MTDELDEQAATIVDLIRSQNWKNGGMHSLDRDEAIGIVMQLVRTAYASGVVAGTKHTGDSMLRVFDAVTGARA